MYPFVVLIYIGLMRKDYEKLFTHLEPKEPPTGLFDRIILAIQREQELRHTKRLAFSFLTLLIISFVATPFSFTLLTEQIENSGILYFFSAAISDLNMFFAIWQDFGIAIIESLPIMGILAFTINLILLVFTVRLFLHKKRLLLAYLMQSSRL